MLGGDAMDISASMESSGMESVDRKVSKWERVSDTLRKGVECRWLSLITHYRYSLVENTQLVLVIDI